MHTDGGGPYLDRALRGIVALIEEGRLQVPISRTYPLSDAAAALELSNTGHVRGKIVLLPN